MQQQLQHHQLALVMNPLPSPPVMLRVHRMAGCVQDWVITDGQHALATDANVQQLQQGCSLHALPPDMAFYTVRLLNDAECCR